MIQLVLGTWLLLAAPMAENATVVQEESDAIVNQPEIVLDDLFRLAELKNPALAAARAKAAAYAGRTRQAELYPNPVFKFEVEELATAAPDFHKEKVTLEQTLIISGQRGAGISFANLLAKATNEDLEKTRRDIYQRIHTHWVELLYFREANAALDELLELANHTLQIASVRFEARAAPESHVTKALLDVYELEATQLRLSQLQTGSELKLQALFGGLHLSMHRVKGTLEPSPVSGLSEADSLPPHPSLNAALHRFEAAEAALDQARAERFPDLGISASYGRIRPTGESFIEAGISIPIPLFNRNQGLIAERSALLAEAEAQVLVVESNFNARIAEGRVRYQAIRVELQILDKRMLPAARRGLAQAQEGYRVGKLQFLELIDAQRTLSDIRLKNLELRRDLVLAEVELASLAGTGPYAHKGEKR